jgi:hypothetical protein
MTAQIADRVHLRDAGHELLAAEGEGLLELLGGWQLRDLGAPLDFTGPLLVGHDFIRALVEARDLSAAMAEERARQTGGSP